MTINIRQIQLPSGDRVPALGQGTWYMGENPLYQTQEIRALQLGIDHGLTLIDTAEMYADGNAERLVGKAIAGRREQVFLVSKVLPHHADRDGTISACEASLKRLNTEKIDLYLLHWPGAIPLDETVEGMQMLVNQGKIGQWGVSNFDVADLQELAPLIDKPQLSTNQVLYNLSRRGIEFDLLPWSQRHQLPTMAYSPIEQGRILNHPALLKLAKQHNASSAQIALAWVLRKPDIIAIPKAASAQHVLDNLGALNLQLSELDLALLDRAFPPPKSKQPLDML